MTRATRIAAPIVALGAIAALAGTASGAAVEFQPQPCVITLEPLYTADVNGQLSVAVPDSAVQCPTFTYNSATTSVNVIFQAPDGSPGPGLSVQTIRQYDPATNAIVETPGLRLGAAYLFSAGQTTYSGIYPNLFEGQYYLNDPGDATKHYRLVLARPFAVVRTTPAPPSCTATLAGQYAYHWDQENYFVVPDSAISCQGFTYSSNNYNLGMSFSSRVIGAGSLGVYTRRVFDRTTGTYTSTNELRLTSYGQNVRFLNEREHGVAAPAGSAGWTWGRFNQDVDGATVSPNWNPDPNSGQATPTYRLTLAQSFAIKRATDVTASGARVAGGKLRVKIHADRNWSFQNAAAPTYRRQTVVPGTSADHAQLRRDGKLIRKVTLSPYGNATVTIPRSGRHRYTVTTIETNDNFAGSAAFTK